MHVAQRGSRMTGEAGARGARGAARVTQDWGGASRLHRPASPRGKVAGASGRRAGHGGLGGPPPASRARPPHGGKWRQQREDEGGAVGFGRAREGTRSKSPKTAPASDPLPQLPSTHTTSRSSCMPAREEREEQGGKGRCEGAKNCHAAPLPTSASPPPRGLWESAPGLQRARSARRARRQQS